MTRFLTHFIAVAVPVLAGSADLTAAEPEKTAELSFGVEWLYSANFYNAHQFNYLTEEGYRVNDESDAFEYTSNAGIYGFLGINFLERFNVSLYSGYMGLYRKRNVIPIELHAAYHFNGVHSDGPFVNAGGGLAFQEYIPATKLSYLAKAGGGWRLAVSSWFSIDAFASIQFSFDKPPILNPEGTAYIPDESIRKSNAQYLAVNFGLALNF